jgi:hypothetical protein
MHDILAVFTFFLPTVTKDSFYKYYNMTHDRVCFWDRGMKRKFWEETIICYRSSLC